MNSRFFRVAALASILSAITTFLLWLLPRLTVPTTTFEASIALHTNPFYMARQWVNFIHIFFCLTAYTGMALLMARRSVGLAALGMVWFFMWGFTELLGVVNILFSVNYTWRAGYDLADEATKLAFRANLDTFNTIWDALFFLLLIAFLLGTTCFGLATWRGVGLEKVISILLLLAAPLTVLILLGNYANVPAAGLITTWTYPLLQPVSRFLAGVWLWQSSKKLVHLRL